MLGEHLQAPCSRNLLIRLDLVADLEVLELLEADTALGALAHLRDVFLEMLVEKSF